MPVDHVTRGLSKIPYQFQDSPNFKHLIQIFLEELQEVEDTLEDILEQQDLDVAVGVHLDRIGEDIALLREGMSDNDYRTALKVKQILNAGEGQFSTVLNLWRTLLGSSTATMEEEFPAGVALFSDVGAPTLDTLNTLTQALPITVTASITATFSEEDAFVFEGGVGAGFGTTGDVSIGGELISRYTSII